MRRHDWALKAGFDPSQPRGPYSGRGPIPINGQWVQPTLGQAALLAALEARADSAIGWVRDIFPNWRPTGSLYSTVEGRIAAVRAETGQAEARIAEFQRVGVMPGLFARESIPARGPERDFLVSERLQSMKLGVYRDATLADRLILAASPAIMCRIINIPRRQIRMAGRNVFIRNV